LGQTRTSGDEETSVGRIYSIAEAAEALNVPRTWLRDKVTAGAVPHTRIGRHVRFTEAHLARIVAAGERSIPSQSIARAATSPTGRARRRTS
jgi:excisionase family DNA binding protein